MQKKNKIEISLKIVSKTPYTYYDIMQQKNYIYEPKLTFARDVYPFI